MPLVFKLRPGERTTREEIVTDVSEHLGCSHEWVRDKISPHIESALSGKNLVADAEGVLQTPTSATSWTLWLDPPDEDSAES